MKSTGDSQGQPPVPLPQTNPQGEQDMGPRSDASETSSHLGEDGSGDLGINETLLSEDEEPPPEQVITSGLFDHSIFRSLLLKAIVTIKVTSVQESEPSTSAVKEANPLFAVKTKEETQIPCPLVFKSTVEEQWSSLATTPPPSTIDKKLYNVSSSFASLIEVPAVDAPLNSLFSSAAIPGDMAEFLKTEDKKLEFSLRRMHQSSAWAIRAATSSSFFARAAIMWLRDLQALIPPDQAPGATFEKHGEHLPRGEGRFGVSRRRHNSSDGFFNNGPLRTAGDCWHQPSLHRHDSVDSGVSKGTHVGLAGSQPGWHGSSRGHDGMSQRGGGTGSHRHWNGNFHSRKNSAFQEKPTAEAREEKEEKEKLQFEEEDFPSLNPEAGKQHSQGKPAGTPSGVWENPPSAKQPTKMLVIKKVSKEDPAAAFSAAFTSPGPQLSNGNKATPIVPSVYKNLVPKPAAPPSKPNQWKSNRSEHKPSSLTSSRDSAFTSPVSVTKPAVLTSGSVLTSSKESPSSTTPPIEINSSRLTKLMRRTTDKKSEFLKALKDDRNGELPERHENKLEDVDGGSTAEPKENWEENCHQNGLSLPLEEGENLSHSLEAEHRLLKAMGWQEYPENDENCLPLTEDELKEFQIKSEQLRRNGFRKSEFLRGQGSSQLFSHWRSTFKTEFEESDTETSSSETSDDDA